MMGGRSLESETKKEIGCYVCNKWQWWIIFPSSTKLGFGGAPLEVLHQMVNLGGGGGADPPFWWSRSTVELLDPKVFD
jgi:hypothetical protein